MKEMTWILVHDDLDGAAAGAVAVLMTDPPKEVTHCSYDTVDWYADELVYKSQPADLIVIADICPSDKSMARLNAIPTKKILVDHHESRRDTVAAYEWASYSDPDCGALGLYKELSRQGYELFGASEEDRKCFEHFLSAVNAYDTWLLDDPDRRRGEWLNRLCGFFGVEHFRRAIEQTHGSIEGIRFSPLDLDDILCASNRKYVKKQLDRVRLKRDGEGNRVGVVIAEQCRSELAHAIIDASSDLDYVVVIDHYRDALSLRSDSVDVGAIASRWGGGGHKNAAGIVTVHQGFLDSLEDL